LGRFGSPSTFGCVDRSASGLSALFRVLNQMLLQLDTAGESATIAAILRFDSPSVMTFGKPSSLPGTPATMIG
jgi:hypothetical protein